MSSRRTLVIRPDNDGDVLLAGPAIRAVAAGSDEVVLWVGARGRAASELLPGVDRIICRTLPWIDLEPEPVDRRWLDDTIDLVASVDADTAIVLSSFHQSPLPTALVLRAAGIDSIAATSVDHPGALLDLRHRIADDVPEVERSLDLVASAGFPLPPDDDASLRVHLPPEVENPVPPGAPYVVVHPGASVPARAWSPVGYADSVRRLVLLGWRVVVTGGPDESELTAEVAGPWHTRIIDLGGRTDLVTLARILADADAVVVGNTGPAHLAAAVGTPVVSLFAPVVPAARWRPWKVEHVLLGNQDIPCAGCRARVCPFVGHPCLAVVSPRDVVDAVGRLTDAAAVRGQEVMSR